VKSVAAKLFLVGLMALFAGGCGYHHGSLMHPQLKTIAIGTVDNQTGDPRLAMYVRQRLPEALQKDGSLRLVSSRDEADCVVHTAIKKYKVKSIGEVEAESGEDRQRFNRTSIFGVSVAIDYQLEIPSRAEPLLPVKEVNGEAEYSELADASRVREDGLRQAIYQAAEQIVSGITEAW
jgi:hypothetical protein